MSLRLFTFALVVLLTSTAAFAVPRMELSETEFNFGYVPQNAQISHVFWIKSVGDDSLKILKVVPGCGCTKAPLEKTELVPGDSAKLEIVFSTKTYRGSVRKTPRIETNVGSPHTNVIITSQVMARPDSAYPLVFKPYKLDLSQFGAEPRMSMEFSVKNVSDQPLSVSFVDIPEELFDVAIPETIAPGTSVKATIRLKSDAVDEKFEKSFTVELNDEARSRYTVPVKRDIMHPPVNASASSQALTGK